MLKRADLSAARRRSVWTADLGDGTFQNPVLHADYSDPDVIRVGEDFYLVASSFSHVPGLPVLHSKDLVNWTILSYVFDRFDLPGYNLPQHGKGVWAPSLRFHEGKFWVFFSAPDEGIFMSTAEDPAGPWTPLHQLKEVKGWIDPCPFWDEDGQAYLIHAFAYSRSGIKHKLQICKMSPDGRSLLDEGSIVFDGIGKHPTLEGPKLYKRNGYYYIFAPAGGVSTGWQVIFRSHNIYGPYEDKVVLHQGDTIINGPHQGGWVELESGESWFVHFQDKGPFGRIIHLQPVVWVDDWPLIGIDMNGDGIGEPVLRMKKPNVGRSWPVAVPATTDHFDADRLGLQWQWQANPQEEWYSLEENPGFMRLYAGSLPQGVTTIYDTPQLLLQKFPAPSFTATTKIDFHPQHASEQAGLIVFGYSYGGLSLRRLEEGRFRLVLWRGLVDNGQATEMAKSSVEVGDDGPVYLRVIIGSNAECRFSYSTDGEQFHAIGDRFKAREGRWVGAKIGIYAVSGGVKDGDTYTESGYADFDWFSFE